MFTNLLKKSEIDNSRFGKRREVSKQECLLDLKNELPKVFKAVEKGIEDAHHFSEQIKPESQTGIFKANLLSTMIRSSIQDYYPPYENSFGWKYAKNERFTLLVNGYVLLFKKLDDNSKPQNILTEIVKSISEQLEFPLFNSDIHKNDPILFFGYKKKKTGEIHSLQIVYIDEDKVKWIIDKDSMSDDITSRRLFNRKAKGKIFAKIEMEKIRKVANL